jgi:hypothetical protein
MKKLAVLAVLAAMGVSLSGCLIIVKDTSPNTPPPAEKTGQKPEADHA